MFNSKISSRQLFYAICCYTLSANLLTAFLHGIMGTDSWIGYLVGSVCAIPFILLYAYLARQHPNQNLFEINRSVFGPVIGFIISAVYLWFFMTLCALTLTDVSRLVNLTLLPETPLNFIKLLIVLVAAWSVKFGPESVTRYGTAVVFISVLIKLVGISFTFNRISIEHFLPLFEAPAHTFVRGIHTAMTIPFGETVVFLMLMPAVKDQENLYKSLLGGFLTGALLLITTVLHDIATLGHLAHYFVIPSFETFRLLTVSRSIGRIDILFATGLVLQVLFRLGILMYGATAGLAQMFKLKDYSTLPAILGVFFVMYSTIVVTDVIEHLSIASTFVPWVWSFIEHFLPVATAVVYLIKKSIKLKKGQPAGVMPT